MEQNVDDLLKRDGRAWRYDLPARQGPSDLHNSAPTHPRLGASVAAVIATMLVMGIIGAGALWATEPRSMPHPNTDSALSIDITTAAVDDLKLSTAWRTKPAYPAHVLSDIHWTAQTLSMPWKLSDLSQDRQTLIINYAAGDGSCVRPSGIVVNQTSSYVAVEVISTFDPSGVCPASLLVERAMIRLGKPLGSRELLHAQVSRQYANSAALL